MALGPLPETRNACGQPARSAVSAGGRGAAWPFSHQQLAWAVEHRWPESTAATVPGDALEIDVRVGDQHCEITYHHDLQFFTFPDQEPLRAPVVIVHTLLRDLAPTIPAVWWSDDDGTPEPFDVQADPEQAAEDFGS